jgi:hypothetical protein
MTRQAWPGGVGSQSGGGAAKVDVVWSEPPMRILTLIVNNDIQRANREYLALKHVLVASLL